MLDDSAVYDRLTAVFRSVFYDDTIDLRPDMTADDIENWDSVNHVNLVVAVEAAFGMSFDTLELEELNTVSDMVAIIRERGR